MLKDIQILPGYNTSINDIGKEFYSPVLSESVSYDRVSGYFSSTSLAYYATGLETFVKKYGRYRLIISEEISESDFELIKQGYQRRSIYKSKVLSLTQGIKKLDTSEYKSIVNLAYLIEIGIVDIKIGFTHRGLFHAKYGIFTDEEGNSIYFTGSFNETGGAFNRNFETISTQKSWIGMDTQGYIDSQKDDFERLWNQENPDAFVFVKEADIFLKSEIVKFSEGKIIMDKSLLSQNALVLYFEEGTLKIKDSTSKAIDEGQRSIKKIKNKFLVEGELWNFRKNIAYTELDMLIDYINKYCKKKNINFVLSPSVTDFIESSKFEIFNISKIGNMIKNKDNSLEDTLNVFMKIVNRDIVRPLRPIQIWVAFYMARMIRAANFSVPGAGKTAMIYGTYAYLSSKEINQVQQLIVIGPKNSFLSWKDEFKNVFGRAPKVIDVHASNFKSDIFVKNINSADLILVNYESLKKYQRDLMRIINSKIMIVFDEVHKIKKIDSERSRIAIELAGNAKYRYVLTGTPLPNSYLDIWNFLHILYNQEYRSYFNFSKSTLLNPDAISTEEINEKVNPFFWRVTKGELNVPDANEDNIISTIATNKEQEVINLLWKKYGREPFKLYIRLIQLASNPTLLKKNIDKYQFLDISVDDEFESMDSTYFEEIEDTPLFDDSEIALIGSITTSSKFEACIDKANELIKENNTIIIWCIFIDTINKVADRLSNLGHKVSVITGTISSAEREKIIKEFQNGEFDVLITNPHTLAESVSLHKICHHALYLEYSFNLTHMLQSRDRIHRLGLPQDIETNYYYFMLEGEEIQRSTIDRKIYNRLKEKEEVMLDAIERNKLNVSLSIDEKTEILKLMEE